ncbi:MAG: hypothetical protein ACOH1E_00150 [Brevundimonas sp.]
MATFTLKLDDETLQKLTAAAKRINMTPERLAEMALKSLLLKGEDFSGSAQETAGVGEPTRAWAGETEEAGVTGVQLTAYADYTGPFIDLDDALDAFSAELNRRRQSALD